MNVLHRVILFSLFLTPAICIGQKITFDFPRKFRCGVNNSVGFEYKGKFDSVVFRFQGNVYSQTGSPVFIMPERLGKDTLYTEVYRRGSSVCKTYSILDCEEAEVYGVFTSNGSRKVSKSYLIALGAVLFYIQITDFHWEPIEIESYRFTILRSDTLLFTAVERSIRYSDKTVIAVQNLRKDDIVVISEIIPKSPSRILMKPFPNAYVVGE